MDHYILLNNYLILGALTFTLGMVGFLTRRNLIVMFLCAEMMLQGVSLTLVGFSAFHRTWAGQVFTIFSLALAGAEAAIALALIVVLFRRHHSLDISLWQDLREPDQPPIVDDFEQEPPESEEQPWPHLTTAGRLPAKRGVKPGDPIPGIDPVPGEHPGVKHREPAKVPHA
jgi:NADH-quinone oxidoreductase subunit K